HLAMESLARFARSDDAQRGRRLSNSRCAMTLGSHQRTVGLSQNHITPRWIVDALGPFDLDPCAADPRPWPCAYTNGTTHGLEHPWPRECFVYLNPPFDRYEVGDWIARLAEHGNGITLLHARTDDAWFEPVCHRDLVHGRSHSLSSAGRIEAVREFRCTADPRSVRR